MKSLWFFWFVVWTDEVIWKRHFGPWRAFVSFLTFNRRNDYSERLWNDQRHESMKKVFSRSHIFHVFLYNSQETESAELTLRISDMLDVTGVTWNALIVVKFKTHSGRLLDKHKSHVRVHQDGAPSTWVPCKQHSWATWEEAGLPYWVWKRRGRRSRVRLYLVRKSELWRVNRAETFLVEGKEERGGRGGRRGRKTRREKEDVGGGRRMSNRVGARQSAHINQGVNEKTAGRMMRRRWGDDEECGAPVAIWLRVCGMLRNIRGGCVTEGRLISFPSVPSESTSVWSHRTGLDPLYNTIRGQGCRVSSSSSPPFSLSSLSLSASLSPPREQSRTREQRHVYVQRTDGHTPTLRTPWAPLKAKTTCCDYIFNIESSSLYNLLLLLGVDLQGFTFYLILACNVNFIAEVLFSKACGIFSLNLWAWDTKYWWFEGFFMKKRGIYS